MRKTLFIMALALASTATTAQTVGSSATGLSQSDSGAMAQTGAITFNSQAPGDQTVRTNPNVYAPPSMFGGANNCGQSSTLGIGGTFGGIGGSIAGESDACNAREDTGIAYKLGYKDVADLRFFCFGEDVNRLAYEATGRKCPDTATAKGSAQARPVVAPVNSPTFTGNG